MLDDLTSVDILLQFGGWPGTHGRSMLAMTVGVSQLIYAASICS